MIKYNEIPITNHWCHCRVQCQHYEDYLSLILWE